MEADSTRGCLENSASGGLAIAKTAAAAVSASTSGRGAGAKTAVTNGLSQSRSHERTCMGCRCHGGEQRRRQPREQRSRGGERAAVAAASASTRKDSLRTSMALHTGYDNPVHINARARAWAANAMEDQSASGGLVNSESAATSPSTSGTGAGRRLQWQLLC